MVSVYLTLNLVYCHTALETSPDVVYYKIRLHMAEPEKALLPQDLMIILGDEQAGTIYLVTWGDLTTHCLLITLATIV